MTKVNPSLASTNVVHSVDHLVTVSDEKQEIIHQIAMFVFVLIYQVIFPLVFKPLFGSDLPSLIKVIIYAYDVWVVAIIYNLGKQLRQAI